MDIIQAYINSGILEEYVLGLLDEPGNLEVIRYCQEYQEVQQELSLVEDTFGQFATAHAVTPPAHLQNQVWDTLENLNREKAMDINDLPLINEYSNPQNWLGLVKPFIPAQIPQDRVMQVLQHTPKVIQMFVISRTDFEDETHDDLQESFMLLEGECECTVGNEVYRVKAGGYTSIPLHVPHTVRIVSPYVIAIMQRVAV